MRLPVSRSGMSRRERLALASTRPSAQATMRDTQTPTSAKASGTFDIGGGLTVNRLGFGAMRLTGDGVWGEPRDAEECRRVLRRAVELDVNLIDTADAYGPEVSERLIAEALYPYPDDLVIATKGGLTRSGPNQWHPNGRPAHLREACEGSLARLRLERIELYQLHRVDPEVPLEESLGALIELRERGQDRAYRPVQRVPRPAPTRPPGHADRLGPEPLQPDRSGGRGRARGMRARSDCLHPVVSAGDRRAREPRRHARADRGATPGDARSGLAGVVASPLRGDAADPGNGLSRSTSRRTSVLRGSNCRPRRFRSSKS